MVAKGFHIGKKKAISKTGGYSFWRYRIPFRFLSLAKRQMAKKNLISTHQNCLIQMEPIPWSSLDFFLKVFFY
jgi:hypothetical protein